MIPNDIKNTMLHALRFKLDFENKQLEKEASSPINRAMRKRYIERWQKTKQALAWLEAHEKEQDE